MYKFISYVLRSQNSFFPQYSHHFHTYFLSTFGHKNITIVKRNSSNSAELLYRGVIGNKIEGEPGLHSGVISYVGDMLFEYKSKLLYMLVNMCHIPLDGPSKPTFKTLIFRSTSI